MFRRNAWEKRERYKEKSLSSKGMPLAFRRPGATCRIRDFCGERGLKRHLDDLGLICGDQITVLAENGSGFIIECKGVRMAMNRGLAQHIVTEDM